MDTLVGFMLVWFALRLLAHIVMRKWVMDYWRPSWIQAYPKPITASEYNEQRTDMLEPTEYWWAGEKVTMAEYYRRLREV